MCRFFQVLCAVFYFVFSSDVLAETSAIVYEDGMGSGWNLLSWSSVANTNAQTVTTDVPFTGTTFIRTNYQQAWGGVNFNTGAGFDTTGWKNLTLAVRNWQSGQGLYLYTMDGQGRRSAVVPLADHSDVWYFPGGQWKWLRIPIYKLNLPGSVITGIFIESDSASEIHFDRVRFESRVTLYEGIRNQRGPTNMLWNWGGTVSEVYSGEDGVLSANFTQSWGGLQFEIHSHSSFWAYDHGLFTALVKTTSSGQDLYVYLIDADTGQAILPAVRMGEYVVMENKTTGGYYTPRVYTPGVWQRVLIPMSDLLKGRNGANVRIQSFMFENAVPGTVLLDDIAVLESFQFPLAGYTGATARITSVMDHSMVVPFCPSPDGTITAFSGEQGHSEFGVSVRWSYPSPIGSCKGLLLRGFKKDLSNGVFLLAGQNQYVPTDDGPEFLFYEGHPGIDYVAPTPQPVFATGSGKISYSDCLASNTPSYSCDGVGKVQIDHGNTLVTSYNHLSSIASGLVVGNYVKKGQFIGMSGATGANSYHLHVSVLWTTLGVYIDPHGWKGPGYDIYKLAKNVCLWEGGC
jgi:hypothetical protein